MDSKSPRNASRDEAAEAEPRVPVARRTFLVNSALLAGAGLLSRPAAGQAQPSKAPTLASHPNLHLVAAHVLPTESLGANETRKAIDRFIAWADAFQPVAELDHPYLSTDEISYGPADPRPLWTAQLEALDLEADQRFDANFTTLKAEHQADIVRRTIDRTTRNMSRLPRPEYAPHIAIAIMAWYFRSSDANDLCYSARIGRHECRGMAGVDRKPRTLDRRSDRDPAKSDQVEDAR